MEKQHADNLIALVGLENRIRAELEKIRDTTQTCSEAIEQGDTDLLNNVLRERQECMERVDRYRSDSGRMVPVSMQELRAAEEWHAFEQVAAENSRLLDEIVEMDRKVRQLAEQWSLDIRVLMKGIQTRRHIQAYERETPPDSLYIDIRG